MKKTYTQSADEVLRDLGVGAEGLTSAQAQERLAKYGPNKLKEAEKPTLLQRFLAQELALGKVLSVEKALEDK